MTDIDYWGLETVIDLKNCDPIKIKTPSSILNYVTELCDLIGMKRFGECQIIDFGNDAKVAGLSFTQLIETSLISGHFVNFTANAYINIFSCGQYNSDLAVNFTSRFFSAEKTTFKQLIRK